ncbi:MAG: M23 family metallopeptidase, partial [Actinomycetota bacterium]
MTPVRRWFMAGLTAAAFAAAVAFPSAWAAAAREQSVQTATSPEAPAEPAYHTYAWPVLGPVIHGYEPPETPYSAGHRGIDIGAPFGSELRAAADGVVAFAGWVGGSLFISIDHPDGVRTTYSWLSAIAVRKGDTVGREQLIGATGHGHPELPDPHLHFGARIGSTY